MVIKKPKEEDLDKIVAILSQWTKKAEVDKYLRRISNEIDGKTEFNQQFWVAKQNNQVLGVGGLADPLPKVLPLSKTKSPGEIKILYIDQRSQGQGVGRKLVTFLEEEAQNQGYTELLVRSAQKYKDTGWGFYEKIGYEKCGTVSGGEETELMQVFRKVLKA